MSGNPEQLNDANREFEQIEPSFSQSFANRLNLGFQIRTVTEGLKFIGSTAYTPPGSGIIQNGPSLAAELMTGGNLGNGSGDATPIFFNVIGNPPQSGVPNPGAEPPIGPEERLRYSCLSGKCLQDPNGVYYGIDECMADGCIADSGGGSGNTSQGCDCGYGPLHTTFKARIISITCAAGGLVTGGKTYWTYSWTEVGALGIARSSFGLGDAVNEHELSIPNNGGNTPPATATLTRKRIPDDAVVTMMLDLTGIPWFHFPNPLQVTCSSSFDLFLDGGTYSGGES